MMKNEVYKIFGKYRQGIATVADAHLALPAELLQSPKEKLSDSTRREI
jgi:hypothetical protein